jgi:hypothetical protein
MKFDENHRRKRHCFRLESIHMYNATRRLRLAFTDWFLIDSNGKFSVERF